MNLETADTNMGDGLRSAAETTYGIGDLSREFGVSLRTLRFYEDKGIVEPQRIGTTRVYAEKDRERIRLALFGKRIGLALADVRRLLDAEENGRDGELSQIFADQRGVLERRIEEDRLALAELDARIDAATSNG